MSSAASRLAPCSCASTGTAASPTRCTGTANRSETPPAGSPAKASETRCPGPQPAPAPPRWSGHSLRRGFATAAKQADADLIETGRHGGWVDGSKSLAVYFEQAGMWDETNPLYGIGL
ncbi:hypothetical protein [Streptomyces sp. NPDC056817]|uniref:hypothetical protein n=1 Tax=Streptomyces sp. NPDC056817 TaxID=3345950 RepID=UPI003686EB78